MSDLGDKVTADDKSKIEGLVKELRDVIQAENFDAIGTKKTELEQALYQISSNVYQQAGGEGAPEAGADAGGAAPDGDDVIDADYTETK
jgi:molecular chaperone DnaK